MHAARQIRLCRQVRSRLLNSPYALIQIQAQGSLEDGLHSPNPKGLVLNLKTQNEAPLLKYLYKFFNKVDIPSSLEKTLSEWQIILPGQARNGSFLVA